LGGDQLLSSPQIIITYRIVRFPSSAVPTGDDDRAGMRIDIARVRFCR
jgi:hypothetical protein